VSRSALSAHGAAVNAFGRHVQNLGRMGDLTVMILAMLHSHAWQQLSDRHRDVPLAAW
jgi:hypothetical protein